jgi:hypothetical protein
MRLPDLGPVIGASRVWADWPSGGPVIAHLSQAAPGVCEAPYGWAIQKTIWEVGPNYTHPVTVRGYDLFEHHTPLLIQFTDSPPTAGALLDPQHPDHPVSVVGEEWAEWGGPFSSCRKRGVMSWKCHGQQAIGRSRLQLGREGYLISLCL